MTDKVSIAISGANGRMGRALQDLLREDMRFGLAATVSASDAWHDVSKIDVVIDFSSPAGFDAALAHCRNQRVAFVSGTTSLGEEQCRAMGEAAREIPVLHTANFSLGIAVLTRLLRDAAAALPNWDLEIVEAHHARKVDAPSGTALALGRAAAVARGRDFEEIAAFGRHGHTGVRAPGTIGFASLRAGDIVGEHTALIAGPNERIELTHRAFDNTILARGALAAAAWLAGRAPGAYAIEDVIAR